MGKGRDSSGEGWPDAEIWPERRLGRKCAISKRKCKGESSAGEARPDAGIWAETHWPGNEQSAQEGVREEAPLGHPGQMPTSSQGDAWLEMGHVFDFVRDVRNGMLCYMAGRGGRPRGTIPKTLQIHCTVTHF